MPSELEKFGAEIKNGDLQRINLWNNNIGDDGAIALADMLRYNTSIQEINLWTNNIGKDNQQMLEKAAVDNPYIRKRLLSNYEATIFKKLLKYRKIPQRIATDISQTYYLCKINKKIHI